MEVAVENTSALGRKMTIEVPAEEIRERMNGRIRELGGQVRLKGFRPGKVPFKVLQQRFGGQVKREIVGELMQEKYAAAIEDQKLRPASQPTIDVNEDKDTFALVANFEVFPELESLDVSTIKASRPVASVGDEDVEEMIETLREQRRTWVDVEDAAGEGDLVFFHYQAEVKDGDKVPEEGESRAGAVLGHSAFDANFEKALEGVKVGDEKTVNVTFTDSAREPALQGKEADVAVRIEKVQRIRLPEVDEEFIKSFGVASGERLDFEREVRQNLERELKDALSRRIRNHVIGRLIESFPDIEIPAGMVDNEAASLHNQAVARAKQSGADESSVPPADAFREGAERRVRGALLIGEVARHAELEVDAGRVRDRVNEIASTYEEPQSVVNLYYQNEQMLSGVRNVVLEEQAVEWVMEHGDVTDSELSFKDAMTPEDAKAEV